ncbi:MAG: hypothetical protein MJ212_05785 [Alphaproteobacteria bacterium]|nr:hypothetical protein [Alphaproteobacteria bacterium]
MPRKNTYNHNCSVKGIVKNFRTATKQTPVPKAITTGNRVLDGILQSRALNKVPKIKSIVKAVNYGPQIGANIARAQVAVTESCKKGKKK